MRPKLTYPNVVSTLCLFLLLGGGAAYAAGHLSKNSVGTKQLKKNAVTAKKIKKNAVTTAKIKKQAVTAAKVKTNTLTGKQINASTLGTVPTAQTANTLPPAEGWHEVGALGEPPFQNSWHNAPSEPTAPDTVAFYKDQIGVVHLKGLAESGTAPPVFQLPAGYRPAAGKVLAFAATCTCGTATTGEVHILGSGTAAEGQVLAQSGATFITFSGITFRAES